MRNLFLCSGAALLVCLGTVALFAFFPAQPSHNILTKAHELTRKYQARITNGKYIIVIDYDLPVFMPRLWVIERESGEIIVRSRVSHAWNSGVLMASAFSNTPGTNQSSIGAFVTADSYQGRFGYSMRIVGLEDGINDKALARAIVFHARRSDLWSLGCFMTRPEVNTRIIDLTKNGTFVYVHRSQH